MVADCTSEGGRSYLQVACAAALVVCMETVGVAPASTATVAPFDPQYNSAPSVVTDMWAFGSGGLTPANATVDPRDPQLAYAPFVVAEFTAYGSGGATTSGGGFSIFGGGIITGVRVREL